MNKTANDLSFCYNFRNRFDKALMKIFQFCRALLDRAKEW